LVVVDASAIVDYLLDARSHPQIGEILQDDPGALNAPHPVDLEVLSTLREMVFDGRLDVSRASMVRMDFESLPIERHSHELLTRRIWELRDNLTPYAHP
jgi:predicted nucleic acid-binding protein